MNKSVNPLKLGYRFLYYIALFGIFFQFFAYPVYAMIEHFPYGVKSKYFFHYQRPNDYLDASVPPSSELKALGESLVTEKKQVTKSYIVSAPSVVVNSEETVLEIFSQDKSGIIGYDNQSGSDDPSDNIFSFNIDKTILEGKKVVLSYDVYGVENPSGIPRSINEQTATGGFFVQKTNSWKTVSEPISLSQLKEGVNHILFTTFENKKLDYKIRDLKITASPAENIKPVHLSDGARLYIKHGKAYIKGIVLDPEAQLFINNKKIPVKNSSFEMVLVGTEEINTLDISLQKKGVEIYHEDIAVTTIEVSDIVSYNAPEITIPVRLSEDGNYGFALADVDINVTKENYEQADLITVQKLRDIDTAPMGTNIINVTSSTAAYRFLPEGAKFKEPAKISLRYNKELLPKGYTANDVKILYFDMDQRRWLSVATDTIIAEENKIVGLTDHFTDYIAGVIQAPESPESNSFTPTSISDIQVADPTANILQLQPPTANQKGDGSLDFPITIPAGRGGLQPNLSVSYNNNGSSGMVGYGWDISIPYISVDTKFGVPKYDTAKETESYILNGEELLFKNGTNLYLPHRSATLLNRVTSTATFVPKVEGSFSKIQRIGSNPTNYSWVVWDKSGTKYYYGSTSVQRLSSESNSGNIAKWMLSKVEDKNGNYIEYNYSKQAYNSGNTIGGREILISSISYTLHPSISYDSNSTGNYKEYYRVEFIYENQSSRIDKNINYRYGFKEVNGAKLQKIEVFSTKDRKERGQFEINYLFNYTLGKFGKQLLSSIETVNIKRKSNNQSIEETKSYKHNFEYYDDVASGLFGEEKTINLSDDFSDERYSALSSSKESYQSHEVNVGAGVSPSVNPPSWWPFSYGGTINFAFPSATSSQSSPSVLLLDIDGDGLDDKVMKIGDEIKYRKNLGGFTFSQQLYKAYNISDLGFSESNTKPGTERSVTIIAGNFNASKSNTNSRIRTFLTDVNGDGLVDYVKDKIVYFNRMDPQSGLPTFTDNSALTPNIIYKDNDVDASTIPSLPDLKLENDLMDVVKVWVAPRKGTVNINGTISKNFVASHNGVRYSVEKSGGIKRPYFWQVGTERIDIKIPIAPWNPSSIPVLTPLPFNPYTGSYVISPSLLVTNSQSTNATTAVEAGDYIFFRVNSSQVPNDLVEVNWDPTVSYTDGNYSSTYSNAFLYGDVVAEPMTIMENGNYRIGWNGFNVSLFDDVAITVKAYRFVKNTVTNELVKTPIVTNTYNVGHTVTGLSNPNIPLSFTDINPDDPLTYKYVEIEVSGKFNIDWKAFDKVFIPKLTNTSISESKHIVPKYDMRSNYLTFYPPLNFTGSAPVQINNNFKLTGCQSESGCGGQYIYMIARYENGSTPVDTTRKLPLKMRYLINERGDVIETRQFNGKSFDSSPTTNSPFIEFHAERGKDLYIEYSADSYLLASALNHFQNNNKLINTSNTLGSPIAPYIPIRDLPTRLIRANISTKTAVEMGAGTMYREWGQFAYKGAKPDENFTPIKKSYISRKALAGISSLSDPTQIEQQEVDLMMDLMEQDLENIDYDFEEESFTSSGSQIHINQNQQDALQHFTILRSDRAINAWSSHERLYVGEKKMSPYLRFYNETYTPFLPIANPTGVSTYGAVSIIKEAASESVSKGKNIAFYGFSVGKTDSEGSSKQLGDFMDINGDGYPDIVGNKIQVTSRRGGLSNEFIAKSLLGTTANKGKGGAVGGGNAHIAAAADPYGRFTSVRVGNNNSFSGNFNIGANKFETTSIPESALVDLNGDGLVDLIKSNGVIEFNTSNNFVPSTWTNYGEPSLNRTTSGALTASFGPSFSTISELAGIPSNGKNSSNFDLSFGFSGSRSITQSEKDFVDFNGDGLPDFINNKTVYFNTGTGHMSSGMALPRLSESSSISHGETINASVLIPIPITFFGLGIIVKVGGGGGKSWVKNYNEDNVSFRDFDGDGYVDMVESVSETELKVRLSKIGRTNMLKKVKNPTGSTIEMDYAAHNEVSGTSFGSTYKMPFKKWVLSKVKVYDGFAGDGEDVQQYAFEYQNGLKDRRERKFLGFGEVKTHRLNKDGAVYRSNVQEYLLNEMPNAEIYLPGNHSDNRKYQYVGNLLRKESTYDGMQRLLSTNTYEYVLVGLNGSVAPSQGFSTGTQPNVLYTDVSRILPLVKRNVAKVRHYQGNSGTSYTEDTNSALFIKYDKYGNVTNYKDETDNIQADIKYHVIDTASKYLVSIPATHAVNTNLRYSSTKIDAIGNIIEINRYKNYGASTDVAVTGLVYDVLGNLAKVTLPSPDGTTTGQRMFYKYEYDNLFHQFLSTVEDAYGYRSLNTYTNFGMPITQTDLNNTVFSYNYDAIRRLTQFKGPYNSNWTIKNEYKISNNGLYYSVTKHNIKDEQQATGEQLLHTSSFSDGLGRIIQTKKQLDITDVCNAGSNGYRFATSGMQVYDEFGRLAESYLGQEEFNCTGTFANALETYTPLTHTVQEKTSMVYDMQDRVLQNHVYGLNATTTYDYGFDTDGFGVSRSFEKVTLPEGNVSVSFKDHKGRVTTTKQIGDNQELATKYKYNILSELVEVANAENKLTKYQYDNFGQKTQTIHPDNGISTFTYDLSGKLIATANQNLINQSKEIKYLYNFNQLKQIDYPSHKVNYFYGAVGASDNGAGRIIQIRDLTGSKNIKYGRIGEVVEEKRVLSSQSSGIMEFTTTYRYDSWGRIMEMVYPDGEKLLYGYNNAGQLYSINNSNGEIYLNKVQYNFFDQPTLIEYGNKVVTTNSYDITQRIRAMQLDRPDQTTFMKNIYEYDKNQNITNITNDFSQHEQLKIGGVSIKNYSYDKFNRLFKAEGNWKGGKDETHNYVLNMAYNKVHGIVNKNQNHQVNSPAFTGLSDNTYKATYRYANQQHPHAPSSIDYVNIKGTTSATARFEYDANGNMTTYNSNFGAFVNRRMIWDEQNRLMAVVDDNSKASHYVYDHAGERTFKAVGTVATVNIGGSAIYSVLNFNQYTLYPSGYMVVEPGKNEYSKHYYINSKRFVSRLVSGTGQFIKASSSSTATVQERGSSEQQTDGLDLKSVMGVQNVVNNITIGNTEANCLVQLNAIIAAYTASNNPPTASVQHCINHIKALRDNPAITKCEALIRANRYICVPVDINNPGNVPDDTTAPVYTPGQLEQFDCLTELHILAGQYSTAASQESTNAVNSLNTILAANFGCEASVAARCCANYQSSGIWNCPNCPELTKEDCALPDTQDITKEWKDCIEECINIDEQGSRCWKIYETTGVWDPSCFQRILECDCNEYLNPENPGNPEDPDDPGTSNPGVQPVDSTVYTCAKTCRGNAAAATACYNHFYETGEWPEGCEQIMIDCGCLEDCYTMALNYIATELRLTPYNNACEVLEYVRTHFNCLPEVLEPETPEIPDETPDDWIDDGGNEDTPVDGPYDESKRKPIWWYHTDHLGSSTYLTDNFGRPSHYYETLPFGEMMVEHNQSTYNGGQYNNVYKFNGKELDDATGMYYYGARYYDPRISIFVSVDPLAEKYPGWTPYHYVHNNPINLIDPTGMSAQDPEGAGLWGKLKSFLGLSSNEKPAQQHIDDGSTVLDEIVIDKRKTNWFQRNFSKDKLANDWKNIKEKSGWNHLANYYDTHDFGLPGVALGGGGSNLHGTQGKPRRDVPWVEIDWLIEIMGALKVGAPSKVPGAGSVHTPDTFGRHGKDTEVNNDNSSPKNDSTIIEVDRYIYWQDDPWKKSPVNGHNKHGIKVYRHQIDSIRNENIKDSIRATKSR